MFQNAMMCTSMVELHSSALQTQEIEIRVVLVLRHTEYLPSFQVKHNFSMTLVLLNYLKIMETVKKHTNDDMNGYSFKTFLLTQIFKIWCS